MVLLVHSLLWMSRERLCSVCSILTSKYYIHKILWMYFVVCVCFTNVTCIRQVDSLKKSVSETKSNRKENEKKNTDNFWKKKSQSNEIINNKKILKKKFFSYSFPIILIIPIYRYRLWLSWLQNLSRHSLLVTPCIISMSVQWISIFCFFL